MKPKPRPELYREQIWRCLLEGVRRIDPEVHGSLASAPERFRLAAWTHLFYDESRDIRQDLPAIEQALAKPGPNAADRAEARSWRTRLRRLGFLIGDTLPFLIPRFADVDMQITLADVRRYLRNADNIGRAIRRNVRAPLRQAWRQDRPVLLIGHSLGSVIAWDTLWEMSRVDGVGGDVDLFLTLGSPLGQRIIQRAIKGSRERGKRRYPGNLRRWANVAAVGELTALDHRFSRDYRAMLKGGLIESIDDHQIYSHFRQDGRLNVHSEYGYLLAETTARLIAEFVRRHAAASIDAETRDGTNGRQRRASGTDSG